MLPQSWGLSAASRGAGGITAELPVWQGQDEPESESSSSWSALSPELQTSEPPRQPADSSPAGGLPGKALVWEEDDFKLQPRVRVVFELPAGDFLEKTFATLPSYAELWLTVRERVQRGGYQLLLDGAALSNTNTVGRLKRVVEAATASIVAPAVQLYVNYATTPMSTPGKGEQEETQDEEDEEEGEENKKKEEVVEESAKNKVSGSPAPPKAAPPGDSPPRPLRSWSSLLPVAGAAAGGAAASGVVCSAVTWLLTKKAHAEQLSQQRDDLEKFHARQLSQQRSAMEEATDAAVEQLHDELVEALVASRNRELASVSGITGAHRINRVRDTVENHCWFASTRKSLNRAIDDAIDDVQSNTVKAVCGAHQENVRDVSAAIKRMRSRL